MSKPVSRTVNRAVDDAVWSAIFILVMLLVGRGDASCCPGEELNILYNEFVDLSIILFTHS